MMNAFCDGFFVCVFAQVQKCFALEKKLRAMDHEIMVNPQYVQKVRGLEFNDFNHIYSATSTK